MAFLTADQLKADWRDNPRWQGVTRPYSAEDVVRLRGSVHVEHTLAKRGAEKLWEKMASQPFVNALGALTGNMAASQSRLASNLSLWLASCRRCQHRRFHVSGSIAVSGGFGAECGQAHQ
jgi:isocitrate lyase